MEIIYNKLVRDKIPEVIEKAGKTPVFYKLDDPGRIKKLLVAKLREEVEEYCASGDYNELADILEVIHGLAEKVHEIRYSEAELIRAEKKDARGGFGEGIFLEKVIG